MIVAAAFLYSTGMMLFRWRGYLKNRAVYNEASSSFTQPASTGQGSASGQATQTGTDEPSGKEGDGEIGEVIATEIAEEDADCAPIEVDFDALRAINRDVIGWVYCKDSMINYPVVHCTDNETYLSLDYQRRYSSSGSIFTDMSNRPGFQDYNVIMYGHRMLDKSMFGTLIKWQNQEWFDNHAVMWLLTPDQDYRVVLFSCYTTSATSDTYQVYLEQREDFIDYLEKMKSLSKIPRDVEMDPEAHYVLLSTCAYNFQNARTVLHGMLVPVSSAGGVKFEDMTP